VIQKSINQRNNYIAPQVYQVRWWMGEKSAYLHHTQVSALRHTTNSGVKCDRLPEKVSARQAGLLLNKNQKRRKHIIYLQSLL